MKSNGIALRTLSVRSVVLTYKGRKITRKPSREESNLVRRTIARRVCKIILSYLYPQLFWCVQRPTVEPLTPNTSRCKLAHLAGSVSLNLEDQR